MTRLRTRDRRLPMPPHIANMTETHEPALALVKEFVEQLCSLPLDGWLAIGHGVMNNRCTAAYSNAWHAVQQAIARNDLGLAAWHVRDEIETLAYVASHSGAPLSRANRPVFAAAHGAAEDAAMSLLVGAEISLADLELLSAPFASQLPAGTMSQIELSRMRSAVVRHVAR